MSNQPEAHSRSLQGRKVLVTGGAGFIGSHLVDRLVQEGAQVRVLDNLATGNIGNLRQSLSRIEFREGDIRNAETCAQVCDGVDLVSHQAALGSVPRSMKDPGTTVAVNVSGTANIFQAARDAGISKVVYASSSSVYGDHPALPKIEGREGDPLSPYALSKVMVEQLAQTYSRCFNMNFVGLRYFNIYGPRQSSQGPYAAVIPRFLQALVDGEAPIIYGDGLQSRDFTFVDDAVEANLQALRYGGSTDVFNIAGGLQTSIIQILTFLQAHLKVSNPPQFMEKREGDVLHSLAYVDHAGEQLGFLAEVSMEIGLVKVLESWSGQNNE